MNAHLSPSRMHLDVEGVPLPPHDLVAEQAVLGGLMLSPESLAKVSDWLTETDFLRKDHRLIFRAVSELQRRGSPCDAVTLGDWFEANDLAQIIGRPSYLIELANATPSAANIVAYAEIVVEKSRLRDVIATGNKIVAAASERGAEPQQIIGTAAYELAQMQASRLRGALEPVRGPMKLMHVERMARYQRGPGLLGQPWPWQGLNDCTKGLRDGVLYVLGARPSMGKSIFGLQVAVFTALRGNNAAFFSVEMGGQECMARAVACVAKVPFDWVENPAKEDYDSEIFWTRLADATQLIIDSPLQMDETPGITIDQLMARARRAHMQKPLRLVVIDHMHDMGIDARREVRHEYGRIAQGAKTLAKELMCPVILLAQLNRSVAGRADKRPVMTDLRESGEIEQKADVILFLHREDYYDRDTHLKGVVEVIPAKGRNIRTGRPVALQNVFSEMRMTDWEGVLPAPSSPTPTTARGFRSFSD